MLDLIKLLVVLAAILFLLWRRWNLGIVLLLASVAIGVLFGRPAAGLVRDGFDAITNTTTLRLVSIVALILALGALLKATAKLEGMVHSLEVLFPDNRVTLAVVPALIGMLPMVGGAMFSAPMVDEIGDHLGVDNNRKTYVNYWFRHVWEWVLPTYPSLILAAALLEVSPRSLALAQWPITAMAIGAGIVVGLLPIERPAVRQTNGLDRKGNLRLLMVSIWPIILVLILSIALEIDLIISLVVTMVLLIAINRLAPGRVWQILRDGVSLSSVFLIVSVMVFRQVVDSTGAVEPIPGVFEAAGIPGPAILFFIPLLTGLLTGLAAGAFGISFPVILPLLAASDMNMGVVALAYTGGFLGVLLSPLHLCFSLSRDYFGAEWGPNYRWLAPSVTAVAIMSVILLLVH
jgi:integral membrane protein (TIGR00529 family)